MTPPTASLRQQSGSARFARRRQHAAPQITAAIVPLLGDHFQVRGRGVSGFQLQLRWR